MKAWNAKRNDRGDFDGFGLPYFGRWANFKSWFYALLSVLRGRPTAYKIAFLPSDDVSIVTLSEKESMFASCIFGRGHTRIGRGRVIAGEVLWFDERLGDEK